MRLTSVRMVKVLHLIGREGGVSLKTIRDLVTPVYPHFRQFTCFCISFTVPLITFRARPIRNNIRVKRSDLLYYSKALVCLSPMFSICSTLRRENGNTGNIR